jgi:branched-chain amino acid transport system ATP-binding protein
MAHVLEITGLHKRFGGIVVADDIALSIAPGQILGLIGPNGAGKTSLFNLIAGVVKADTGVIRLNGERIDRMAVHGRARTGLSRTWQHIRLFPSLTILENLLVAPRHSPDETPLAGLLPGTADARQQIHERALAQLAKVKMLDAADRFPSELSYGKQKLISIARALMNDGNCLLLDEPMAGVEGPAYDAIKGLVRDEAAAGRAICVVEHNISFVRDLCDSAVFMFNGRIMARGTVEDLVRNPDLTELYFGT